MESTSKAAVAHTAIASTWVGWSLALGATFASSIVTPIVRGAVVGGMNPITLLLLRLSLSVVLLGGTVAIMSPRLLRLERRGWLPVALVGVVNGVEICCFFWSLAFVDSSMTAMIKSVQPLVVLLMLALGGERLTRLHLLRLGLAACGIYLLVGPSGNVAPFGLLLLTGSIFLYALQLVLTQWWLASFNPQTVTLYLLLIMNVIIAIWWSILGVGWQAPSRTEWLVVIVLALVSTWFARLAIFGAIQRIGSGQVALLWPVQTLLIIVLSVLFLNERMMPIQRAGGALIVSSAALAIRRFRMRTPVVRLQG